eukprot:Trichotokara_eunicae@DN5754_c0_g1_i3.p1
MFFFKDIAKHGIGLYVADPLDENNNLGRSSVNIAEIKGCLAATLCRALNAMPGEVPCGLSFLSTSVGLDLSSLRRRIQGPRGPRQGRHEQNQNQRQTLVQPLGATDDEK